MKLFLKTTATGFGFYYKGTVEHNLLHHRLTVADYLMSLEDWNSKGRFDWLIGCGLKLVHLVKRDIIMTILSVPHIVYGVCPLMC